MKLKSVVLILVICLCSYMTGCTKPDSLPKTDAITFYYEENGVRNIDFVLSDEESIQTFKQAISVMKESDTIVYSNERIGYYFEFEGILYRYYPYSDEIYLYDVENSSTIYRIYYPIAVQRFESVSDIVLTKRSDNNILYNSDGTAIDSLFMVDTTALSFAQILTYSLPTAIDISTLTSEAMEFLMEFLGRLSYAFDTREFPTSEQRYAIYGNELMTLYLEDTRGHSQVLRFYENEFVSSDNTPIFARLGENTRQLIANLLLHMEKSYMVANDTEVAMSANKAVLEANLSNAGYGGHTFIEPYESDGKYYYAVSGDNFYIQFVMYAPLPSRYQMVYFVEDNRIGIYYEDYLDRDMLGSLELVYEMFIKNSSSIEDNDILLKQFDYGLALVSKYSQKEYSSNNTIQYLETHPLDFSDNEFVLIQ